MSTVAKGSAYSVDRWARMSRLARIPSEHQPKMRRGWIGITKADLDKANAKS